jgi:hypothetical protein
MALVLYARSGPRPGHVPDEALRAGRAAASFPAADEDYFRAMDGGHALTPDQVKGRNMWLVWSGGNDRFWDLLTNRSFGTFDLLKTVSSAPNLPFGRSNRWSYFGVINEPCFDKPTGPDNRHFGLWLDQRRNDCPADPFDNPDKYPGVKLGARGNGVVPVGSYYGEPTGIVGLRLFPNPDFDEKARKAWDAKRYYTDPSYYESKTLVRPYRVGMSCGFCHIGPSPVNPPSDPENPAWENLNSTVGSQYFWFDRVFVWSADEHNYVFQLLHTYLPGTLDTSLVSSDSIVNPRTMNAIYNLPARLEQARRYGTETLTGGQLNNKQFNDFFSSGPLTDFYRRTGDTATSWTPRVLKDGSDSVGVLGALNRVYVNIGLFSEEWLLHFTLFTGGTRLTPFEIASAKRNSIYWQATEAQTPLMAQFLLAAGLPDRLADTPDAARYLTADAQTLAHGRSIFAERCARCHSSKLPQPLQGMDRPDSAPCAGPNYMACWTAYWNWTKTEDFKAKMRAIAEKPDFLDNNYLSTEFRVPVTLLRTNACSPLATNAIAGNVWDNFSSQSYKNLPSVGTITVQDPFTGANLQYTMPAGGRGYTRPPSLVSLWSTAPYLLNNSVGGLGAFQTDPSIAARMQSFEQGMEQMLWPERRERDSLLGDKGVGYIQRTTATSYLTTPAGYMPDVVVALRKPLAWLFPNVFDADGGLKIGPIPKGTPVGLLGDLNILSEEPTLGAQTSRTLAVISAVLLAKRDLAALPANVSDAQADKIFLGLGKKIYKLSKCPDYVVNRGHYFGTDMFDEEKGLTDQEKHDLIAFLKTF